MNLPNLPKVLKKREADWTTSVLNKWILQYGKTFAWEVKHTRGKDYLNFNEVTDKQLWNLLTVKHRTLNYKIPDMGGNNPFDGFCMTRQPAYVIIKYPNFAVGIDIDIWAGESSTSKRRSLTKERAKELSTFII